MNTVNANKCEMEMKIVKKYKQSNRKAISRIKLQYQRIRSVWTREDLVNNQ